MVSPRFATVPSTTYERVKWLSLYEFRRRRFIPEPRIQRLRPQGRAELRQRAAREGHCYQHVQAITVAIDQYAEKELGNRDYFLNKPYGVG
jgi:hypothetical protein